MRSETLAVGWGMAAEQGAFVVPLMGTIGAYFAAWLEGYEVISFAKPYLLTLGSTALGASLIAFLQVLTEATDLSITLAVVLAVAQPLVATAWVSYYTEEGAPHEEKVLETDASRPDSGTSSSLQPRNTLSFSVQF